MSQLNQKDIKKMRFTLFFFGAAIIALATLMPELGFANVDSSLQAVQYKLSHVILPTLSVIGIAWAAFSFLTGNENAKKHILYAVVGTAIGFGAQAISDFISGMVR